MSYTPTTWNTGDTITASAMNKIENGIANAGGGGEVITDTSGTLNKTYAEIFNLMASGMPCYIKWANYNEPLDLDSEYTYSLNLIPILRLMKYDDVYRILASNGNGLKVGTSDYAGTPELWVYSVSSSSGYPTFYRRVYVNDTSAAATTIRD